MWFERHRTKPTANASPWHALHDIYKIRCSKISFCSSVARIWAFRVNQLRVLERLQTYRASRFWVVVRRRVTEWRTPSTRSLNSRRRRWDPRSGRSRWTPSSASGSCSTTRLSVSRRPRNTDSALDCTSLRLQSRLRCPRDSQLQLQCRMLNLSWRVAAFGRSISYVSSI